MEETQSLLDHHQQHLQHDGELDEDWEEWDGRSPFWIHCVAGSLAGVTEVRARRKFRLFLGVF